MIPKYKREVSKNEAIEKRITNINFIRNLPRENLAHKINECQLLFDFYKNEYETISIQYPGKESDTRPWDFRPKLLLADNNYLDDLSFKNIWDCLFEINNNNIINPRDKKRILKLLACEFYRIAFMIDYDFIPPDHNHGIYYLKSSTKENFISEHGIYIYKPNYKLINELEVYCPTILGISWESFFIYNDLLALNEDCKYFFNKFKTKNDEEEAKAYIKKGTGRINTMLTHIHILSVILGENALTTLLTSFSNGRGVAPLTIERCNNFLSEYMY